MSQQKDQKSFSAKIKFFQCAKYFQFTKSFGISGIVDLSSDTAWIEILVGLPLKSYVALQVFEAFFDTSGYRAEM